MRPVKRRNKKKIKTNEIRINVKYQLRDFPMIQDEHIFVANTLKDCVRDALHLAQRLNYVILEMDLLTTED